MRERQDQTKRDGRTNRFVLAVFGLFYIVADTDLAIIDLIWVKVVTT